MRKHFICFICLGIFLIMMVTGCSDSKTTGNIQKEENTETLESQVSREELEQYYQNGKIALEEENYESAIKYFYDASGFLDSNKYYAYSKGMQITQFPCSIYESYKYFKEAGDLENAQSNADELRKVLDYLKGTWESYYTSEYSEYYTFNEEGKVDNSSRLNQEQNFIYDVRGQISYYGISQNIELTLSIGLGDSNKYNRKIEMDGNGGLYIYDLDNAEKELYSKMSASEIEETEIYEDTMENVDEIKDHLDDFRILSIQEAKSILLDEWEVSRYFDTLKVVFNTDGTYTYIEEDNSIKTREWEIIDNTICLNKRPDGGMYNRLEIRKYQEDKYLFIKYTNLEDVYWVYIATPTRKSDKNSNKKTESKIQYFDEVWSMPTPDTCLKGVVYEKIERNSDAILYTYRLPDNEDDANAVYHKYQKILKRILDIEVDKHEIIYAYANGVLKSAIEAGKDKDMGYFMMVSFQN